MPSPFGLRVLGEGKLERVQHAGDPRGGTRSGKFLLHLTVDPAEPAATAAADLEDTRDRIITQGKELLEMQPAHFHPPVNMAEIASHKSTREMFGIPVQRINLCYKCCSELGSQDGQGAVLTVTNKVIIMTLLCFFHAPSTPPLI